MKSPGEVDPLYVKARQVLLDVLDALGPHRKSIVLVGAQAVYLHTGDGELAVAPYTTDGDVMIDPRALSSDPKLTDVMHSAGCIPSENPGIWTGNHGVQIDLLVPEALGGPGRRGASLGDHGRRVARKVHGLEGALIDNSQKSIASLEQVDSRKYDIAVAGPAALLVAKLHKISDRINKPDRQSDKDALDILRLLQSFSAKDLAQTFHVLLENEISATVTRKALAHLRSFFEKLESPGSQMAARAAIPLEDPDTIAGSCALLARELLGLITMTAAQRQALDAKFRR